MSRLSGLAPILAILIAGLGAFALSVEAGISLTHSLRDGYGLLAALYIFLRFFTILTNIGVSALMGATAWRLARGGPAPPATLHGAALVYAIVVGVTYEAILRALWSPSGIQFYTDMIMHDIVPVLTLAFWIAFAPKTPLTQRDPVLWLAIPALYFALTLVAGALGAGYPYHFFDTDDLGPMLVIRNALVFLAFFYGLGVGLVVVARKIG